MRATIAIGDQNVEMVSNAAVDIVYRQVFHEDVIKFQYEMDDNDVAGMLNCMLRMGFIMAKAAELESPRELMQLTEDDFVGWLIQFDRVAYVDVLPQVRDIYEGQKITTSDAKKNPDPQTDQ